MSPARTLIRDVRVFDGSRAIPRADVLIEDDHIAELDADVDRVDVDRVDADVEVDGTGRTLLPGLIDAHTHTFDGSLARALTYGVTTELDMFCLPSNLARQRKLAERDDVADLRSSGVLATAPGGHPTAVMTAMALTLDEPGDAVGWFDTIEDAERAEEFVAARLAEGSDYLKIVIDDGSAPLSTSPATSPSTSTSTSTSAPIPTIGRDLATALVDAARAVGLRTIAHVATARDTAIALDAGVDGLAHVWSDKAPGHPDNDELIRRVAAQGVFVVSTLVYIESLGGDDTRRVANAAYVASALHRAGVPVLAGTDANPYAPAHGDGLHRELELLTRAGLSPSKALAAGTAVPARHFGLSDRGRIAPGLRADLLLVEGDPTRDIAATRAIVAVWRRGVALPLPR
ncbi:amidohydrolase family protein [Streptomyces sp. NBC_01508]|uniref:amidohydrolase family protein n=1 Tax=Streptomyces sp. NBC_01508 TaxID=2903888 RepID=UPI00386F4308